MAGKTNVEYVVDLLAGVRDHDEGAICAVVEEAVGLSSPQYNALLRTAVHFPSSSPKYIRRLGNAWRRAGGRALKKSRLPISIEILSDGTTDGIVEPLRLFLASYGIEATITLGAYDSFEFEALAGERQDFDVTCLLVSERWVRLQAPSPIPLQTEVDQIVQRWRQVVEGLSEKRRRVVISEFLPSAWPIPSARAAGPDRVTWHALLAIMNNVACDAARAPNVFSLGVTSALQAAGGHPLGRISMVRMRSALEPEGLVSVAREMGAGIAHLFGRAHRALLLDWDNTLWGGEVGEVGPLGIELGPETPDGFAYQLLQAYIRDLNLGGTLLAAISRNDPAVGSVLEENTHLLVRRSSFASIQLSWGNKSESAQRIIQELNFGSDFMVYVDDNHVDLAQVLDAFPDMDVILAGPEADQTLDRLAGSRLFTALNATAADVARADQASSLREQRDAMSGSSSREEFLASLGISISSEGLHERNRDRVLQLLQKTNQFNLTTKRHDEEQLRELAVRGAHVGVFSYEDRFGSQGIIGLVILVPITEGWEIDTWLMSCRVLNRGVEEAMLDWMKSRLQSTDLFGTYFPTEKNGLVESLFNRMGFSPIGTSPARYTLRIEQEK